MFKLYIFKKCSQCYHKILHCQWKGLVNVTLCYEWGNGDYILKILDQCIPHSLLYPQCITWPYSYSPNSCLSIYEKLWYGEDALCLCKKKKGNQKNALLVLEKEQGKKRERNKRQRKQVVGQVTSHFLTQKLERLRRERKIEKVGVPFQIWHSWRRWQCHVTWNQHVITSSE